MDVENRIRLGLAAARMSLMRSTRELWLSARVSYGSRWVERVAGSSLVICQSRLSSCTPQLHSGALARRLLPR